MVTTIQLPMLKVMPLYILKKTKTDKRVQIRKMSTKKNNNNNDIWLLFHVIFYFSVLEVI